MNRYKMEVVVRANSLTLDEKFGERLQKCNVSAENELVARRCALEQAWAQGLLVSQFLRMKKGREV